jgi:hypothetical protein
MPSVRFGTDSAMTPKWPEHFAGKIHGAVYLRGLSQLHANELVITY